MREKHPLAKWRESQTPPVTQDAFASALKVTRWTINSIELGRRSASAKLAAKIITATDGKVTASDLFPAELAA